MVSLPSARFNSYTLFALTIFTGSFLLFLIQPLIARQALPLLGGAPAVWNSAMVVFQMLLLGGYIYAHLLARLAPRKQAVVHTCLLVFASLTLPVGLADIDAGAQPVVGVPLLFVASIGPVFLLLSAQASLLQRWYADGQGQHNPYRLYAISNIGSFAGLAAYPFLIEPNVTVSVQSLGWSAGFVAVVLAIALLAYTRRSMPDFEGDLTTSRAEAIGWRRKLLWIVLAAVPCGLVLSTTTLLTTDLMAMPLLWIIPLGLYLLSFSVAFSDEGQWVAILSRIAPVLLLLIGSLAMISGGRIGVFIAVGMIGLLFILAVALHGRLYSLRPAEEHLTLFYLFVATGGVLGGAFVAIVAPLIFDWIYEHVILLLAAALLLPARRLVPLPGKLADSRFVISGTLLVACVLAAFILEAIDEGRWASVLPLALGAIASGILLIGHRLAFTAAFALLLLSFNGLQTIQSSLTGERSRSYFGIYSIETGDEGRLRRLVHGTTMHGEQWLDGTRRLEPTAYYGRTSGAGLALTHADPAARVGVVGLGVGTLACYRKPGQQWSFYEIDREVAQYSRNGTFTFLNECAPDAGIAIGDARIRLSSEPARKFDILVLDAFSSDAIPLHLLTREAFSTYDRVLADDGILVAHISNRFVDLAPSVSALAAASGWAGIRRSDDAIPDMAIAQSDWVVLSADRDRLDRLVSASGVRWDALPPPADTILSDEKASLLPLLRF